MKIKKFGKFIAAFYVLTFVVGYLANSDMWVFANNYKDAPFDFIYNGDGSDYAIKARQKVDNTYSYVNLSSSSDGTMNVSPAAKEGIGQAEWGDALNPDYCGGLYQVKPGYRKYFPNDAHKRGFFTTYLLLSSYDHKVHYFNGKWSPDNCSGYGTP